MNTTESTRQNLMALLQGVSVVIAASLVAPPALAGDVTAELTCRKWPDDCTPRHWPPPPKGFSIPGTANITVKWKARFDGKGSEPREFRVGGGSMSAGGIFISTSKFNAPNGVIEEDTTTIIPGPNMFIGIQSGKMGPGWYNLSATEIVGEPHITTINGIRYDFQSAGEFVVLRQPEGFELQTRMTPIATLRQPGPDPYSGLATCVSINTAVAAKVGKRRVTYQPNINGKPDPSGLQLRVDGKLAVVGRRGLDLGDGGRITTTERPGELDITFSDNTTVTVTPLWWPDQSLWYLNIGTFAAAGALGIAGAITTQNWLPLLPDGRSLGIRPDALHDRFVALYETFADAWRVTDDSSLFDYAPGTSTRTYTLRSWPKEQPPCELPFTVPVPGASQQVAERACAKVKGPSSVANCVFDVMATGHPGFADAYVPDGSKGTYATGSKGTYVTGSKKYPAR